MGKTATLASVAAAAVFCACRIAAAAEEPATRAGVYTQQDYYREVLAADREQLIGGYDAVGRRGPAWDGAARHALDLLATAEAQRATVATSFVPLYPDPTVSGHALRDAARAATGLGCDDPMVLYAEGAALLMRDETRDARRAFAAADAAMAGHVYPSVWRLRLLGRRMRLAGDGKAFDDLWARVRPICADAVRGPFATAGAHRDAAREVIDALKLLDRKSFEAGIAAFAADPAFDPWTRSQAVAEIDLRDGWDAHGGDGAYNLPPDVRETMERLVPLARQAAEAAYAAHPDYPESAATLVRLDHIAGDTAGVQAWFGRATTAQLDDSAAYDAVWRALWGSDAASMTIADAAAATDRYDTAAPFEYLTGVMMADGGRGSGRRPTFADAERRRKALAILAAYGARQTDPARVDYFKTCAAVVHLTVKEPDAARKLLDEVPGDLDYWPFQTLGQDAQWLIEDAYLAGLNDPKGVADFRRASGRRYYKNAGRFLQGLLDRDQPTGRTAEIVRRLKAAVDLMQAFNDGREVSLMDESARGFWDDEGRVEIHPGPAGLAIRPSDRMVLLSRFQFSDRHYELHVKFEFDDPEATRDQTVRVGCGYDDGNVGWIVALNANPGTITAEAPVAGGGMEGFPTKAAVPRANAVDIVYFDGIPTVTVNGTRVPMDAGDPDAPRRLGPVNRLILASTAGARFTEVRLRHLAAKP